MFHIYSIQWKNPKSGESLFRSRTLIAFDHVSETLLVFGTECTALLLVSGYLIKINFAFDNIHFFGWIP